MINFKSIQIVISKYSFVGIQKKDDFLEFHLPTGFEQKDYSFSDKQDLFFLLYKVLNTFKKICFEKGYIDDLSVRDRDGVIKSDRGSNIQSDEDSSENIFYSKLDIIGKLLDAYDEPKILALAYRLGITDKFDVSKIHKYLHQAVFLPNNAAYVDQMTLPRRVMQFESTDVVTMYCYLFCEVKLKLKENVSSEISSLAERFRQKYLGSEDSIFDEQTYEQVLDILKDALETIAQNTPIKDTDFWQYYEAIELFLYGDLNQSDNGQIWGISNFYSVWESICLTYLAQTTDPSLLLYIDNGYLSSQIIERINLSPKSIDLSKIFGGKKLRPDAVAFRTISSQIKIKRAYKISEDNWNDYGYRTNILGLGEIETKVAYIGQETKIHTIQKLSQIFDRAGKYLGSTNVDERLPENFYSFWNITKQIDFDYLSKMQHFNHFFYIALEKRIFNWEEFNEKILRPLDINSGNSTNVFTISLFRDMDNFMLKKKFNHFIQETSNQYKDFFEIIDIKYQTFNHFHNTNNIEEIKKKDARKQFVYEYLLQKEMEKRGDQFSDLRIQSSFWLPSDRPNDPNLLQDSDKPFMDNYIHLKNVNFSLLAESYIASASSYF